MKAFGKNGHFNEGTDATFSKTVPVDICSDDYSPALRLLGKAITSALSTSASPRR